MSPEGSTFIRTKQRETYYEDTQLNIEVSKQVALDRYASDTDQDMHNRAVAVQAGMEALSKVRSILDVAAVAIECSRNGEQ
jgi:hypothetical protein